MPYLNIVLLASALWAPPESVPENLTHFDGQNTTVEWFGGRWQIRAGTVTLKDFDRQETEAREALRLIHELKLTHFGTVGSPRPTLEYWLSDGRPPSNSIQGLRSIAFDRTKLSVAQMLGQWCIRDGKRVLFSFGARRDDAEQALAVIRKYNFDRVGYFGRPTPVMMYFLTDPQGAAVSALATSSLAQTNAEKSAFPRQILHGDGKEKQGDATSKPGQDAASELMVGVRQLGSVNGLSTTANEDRVAIDWRRVEIRHDGRDWKLASGNYVLADLGPSESDARVALAVVQHYRFTEHCLIGRPKVLFSYFLSNGRAPRELCTGAHNTPFRPELLTVQKRGDDWIITDGGQALCHFGDKSAEARQALQAIHQYHFDTLCQIGAAPAQFAFLIRSR
ncbi:MAG TPA: hypothetical protein VGY58_07000 [Gemmataceae bacterium]|nr:hypothetical protein [Gemmataceae bacterium]